METIWNLTKNVKVCIFNTSTKIKFVCSPKVSNEGTAQIVIVLEVFLLRIFPHLE